MHPRSTRPFRTLAVFISAGFLQTGGNAVAGTHTWAGPLPADPGALWSDAANWNGGVPVKVGNEETIVVFNSGSDSTCDLADVVVDRIVFNGGNNRIGGSLTMAGNASGSENFPQQETLYNILDLAGGNEIHGSVTAAGTKAIAVRVVTGASLDMTAAGSTSICKTGAGTLTLASATGRTGETHVQGGMLLCGDIVESKISVGLMQGTVLAKFRLTGTPSGAPSPENLQMHIMTSGTVDMDGRSAKLAELEISGGELSNVGPRFEVTGATKMTGGTISGAGTFYPTGNVYASMNETPSAVIRCKIGLEAERFFSSNSYETGLTLTGAISGDGGLTTSGAVAITGYENNSYLGLTSVQGGSLIVDSTGIPIPGDLEVKGEVSLLRADQLPDDAHVSVESNGTLRLSGNETIGSMFTSGHGEVLLDGQVTLTLADADSLEMVGGIIMPTHHTIGDATLRMAGNGKFTPLSYVSPQISANVVLDGTRVFLVEDGTRPTDFGISGKITGLSTGSGVVKTGAGTMVLAGENGYTGPTNVNEGTVVFAGNTPQSKVTVAGGAEVRGDGKLGSLVTKPGGIVTPVTQVPDVGVLAADSMNLSGGKLGLLVPDRDEPSISSLKVGGNLNLTGTVLELQANRGYLSGHAYVIASYGTLTGKFSSIKAPQGFAVDYAYRHGGNTRNIALIQVTPPEITLDKNVLASGAALNFRKVVTGKKSTRTFTITNYSGATLENLDISLLAGKKSGFTLKKPSSLALAAGRSLTFSIAFSPKTAGAKTAEVRVKSTTADVPPFVIKLKGSGKVVKTKKKSAEVLATLTGGKKNTKAGESAGKKKAGTPGGVEVVSQGTVVSGGLKFASITVRKTSALTDPEAMVEVSGDLLRWSSGPKHVTLVSDDGEFVTVRDNVPLSGGKRFIRVME